MEKWKLASGETASSGLIQCSACAKNVSLKAEACPHCGEPNESIHPAILQMEKLAEHDEFPIPINAEIDWDSAEVWGVEQSASDIFSSNIQLWTLISFLCLIIYSFTNFQYPVLILVSVGIMVAGFVANHNAMQPDKDKAKRQFRADFVKGVWEGNDDDYWKEVREALGFTEKVTPATSGSGGEGVQPEGSPAAPEKDIDTKLAEAASENDKDRCVKLLAEGADPKAKSKTGFSAYDAARARSYNDLIKLFRPY